jgi:hypothetical protein
LGCIGGNLEDSGSGSPERTGSDSMGFLVLGVLLVVCFPLACISAEWEQHKWNKKFMEASKFEKTDIYGEGSFATDKTLEERGMLR